MVEVAVGWVEEEVLLFELVAERDRARIVGCGRGSVGLLAHGEFLCAAHLCGYNWELTREILELMLEICPSIYSQRSGP